MKPFRATTFFGDSLSGRPLVENTIPRGYLRSDTALFTGKKTKSPGGVPTPSQTQSGPQPTATAPTGAGQTAAIYPDDVETFPFPITEETVKRGRERYDIFWEDWIVPPEQASSVRPVHIRHAASRPPGECRTKAGSWQSNGVFMGARWIHLKAICKCGSIAAAPFICSFTPINPPLLAARYQEHWDAASQATAS